VLKLKIKANNFVMLTAQWLRILIKHLSRPALLASGVSDYLNGTVSPEARLSAVVIRGDGTRKDLGIISTKSVTTAFVNFVVDQLQAETSAFGDFKFHGMGTGVVVENISDTALGTAVETRATGTQVEGASANIYRSVGTITATASRAITEHGLFNAATGGTLMDRSVFSVINLVNTDSIQFTYELTLPAGG